jgi:tetratricopeptide (TPR) repeat protein
MLPEEIYAGGASSAKFQYSHPLSHKPIDDSAMRSRLAYDLMEFMGYEECPYYSSGLNGEVYDPHETEDEIDTLIVEGNYKEASLLIEKRLKHDPDCDKTLFQQAFIRHLKMEYKKILDQEERILRSDPYNVNALINKSFALANLNREEEALEVSNRALRIEPDNMIALSNKALIAKSLSKDTIREQTLAQAYNVSARNRMRELQRLESKLLHDFESAFMASYKTVSAFDEFNKRSGIKDTVH